jgi:arylsulfatase A-like enzyme
VLGALRATGVEQDTMVLFLSDNGCPTYTRAGSNGPLNGAKLTLYEGGFRVPFMARWPGKIQPRQVIDTPVVSRDIFPTLLKAAAVDLPKDREFDGLDLMPLLSGATQRLDRDALFWRNGPNKAVRRGDWKLIQFGDQTRLYNLKSDLGEKRDVAAANAPVVAELKNALADWNKQLVPAKWPTRLTVDIPVNGQKIGWTV